MLRDTSPRAPGLAMDRECHLLPASPIAEHRGHKEQGEQRRVEREGPGRQRETCWSSRAPLSEGLTALCGQGAAGEGDFLSCLLHCGFFQVEIGVQLGAPRWTGHTESQGQLSGGHHQATKQLAKSWTHTWHWEGAAEQGLATTPHRPRVPFPRAARGGAGRHLRRGTALPGAHNRRAGWRLRVVVTSIIAGLLS